MRTVEQIEQECRAFETSVQAKRHALELELADAREHRKAMVKQAKHLEVRVVHSSVGTFYACASPKASDGSFWVGVGPENKLLVAYEYVQAHRYLVRSGRVMGKPIPNAVAEGLMLDALDGVFGVRATKRTARELEIAP